MFHLILMLLHGLAQLFDLTRFPFMSRKVWWQCPFRSRHPRNIGFGEGSKPTTYAIALRNIENAGFKVAHIHGNNNRYFYGIDGYLVPRVLEVTVVKRNRSLEKCETKQHLHPLDHDNNHKAYPSPMANLPA